MPEDRLLIGRLEELKLDVQRVGEMLGGARKQRANLTMLSELVRTAGEGTIGEPLSRAMFSLAMLTGEGAPAELTALQEHLVELSSRLKRAATCATDIGNRLEDLKIDGSPRYQQINEGLQDCDYVIGEIDGLVARIRSGMSDDDAWSEFDAIAKGCRPLFTDYVDFLAGVTLRDYGLDNGVARLADRLFEELSVGGVAMPTRSADLEAPRPTIIRFHFPEWEIWDVPLGGYHAGMARSEKLSTRPAIMQLGKAHPAPFASDAFCRQLFSEVYAARMVGPAYAYAALLLHLHPRHDTVRTPDNPSALDRAYAVLATLREYGDTGSFGERVEELATWWSVAAGGAEKAWPADAKVLDEFVRTALAGPLKQRPLHNIPYDPDQWRRATTNVTRAEHVPVKSVLDRLNAAWHLRITDPDEAMAVTATSEGGGSPEDRTTTGRQGRSGTRLGNTWQNPERQHGE